MKTLSRRQDEALARIKKLSPDFNERKFLDDLRGTVRKPAKFTLELVVDALESEADRLDIAEYARWKSAIPQKMGLVERVARAEFGRSLKSDPVSTAVTFESSRQRIRDAFKKQIANAREPKR